MRSWQYQDDIAGERQICNINDMPFKTEACLITLENLGIH